MALEKIGKSVYNKINALELAGTLVKKEAIIEIYGEYDYFKARSFDVFFCSAKVTIARKLFEARSIGIAYLRSLDAYTLTELLTSLKIAV